ncbi:MAG: glutamate--tRNA ligase [Rhodospirillales bacterium]|nr:glutamate--tRNA ligase [Rhodospirillales bacterium]
MNALVTRFAPSPTGLLHVGNARVALVNWLLARSTPGGRFLLRIDDTDPDRSKPEFVTAIERDLRWLGLDWDDQVKQRDRTALYREAADRLIAYGRLYRCYETPEELDRMRRRLRAAHKPPIYDRRSLTLTDDDRRRFESEGRQPYWRFKITPDSIAWTDLVRGSIEFNGRNLSDPIVIRADQTFLYVFTSVVDDIALGLTDIVRGEDHVTNTAVQIQMFAALGKAVDDFAFSHLPLLTDLKGEGLSKRLGGYSLEQLRDRGIEPMAVASLLAKLGTMDAIEPRISLDRLRAEFSMTKFGRAAPKFDPRQLDELNAKLLHEMSFTVAGPRLAALGLDGTAEFWDAIRPNLTRFDEIKDWYAVCFLPMAPVIADQAFANDAAQLLPSEPWDQDTWKRWTDAVKIGTKRSGKDLFHPLRLALTGRTEGPELKRLLPLIGRDRALKRLGGTTA